MASNVPRVSVIICAHQPNQDHLRRTLEALSQQSLSITEWELVVVDNHSEPPLDLEGSLSWHPHAKCVREETLGLTSARCCGIRQTCAALLVFVDVDNVLRTDYLETALSIAAEHPRIGVWSGQSHPEFEETPAEWTRPYWPMLAVRKFDNDTSMMTFDPALPLPHGAGMCVRRNAALAYLAALSERSLGLLLDRRGECLMSGGDDDIALISMGIGLGVGNFSDLHLHHLIPPQRLDERYLLRLREAMAASGVVLDLVHCSPRCERPSKLRSILRSLKCLLTSNGIERRMHYARVKGEQRGWSMIENWQREQNDSPGP